MLQGITAVALALGAAGPNMNGDYVLSETAHSDTSKYPTNYADYPGEIESFDVYSPPIVSLYSQVFWEGLDPVPLPTDIVQKYNGKTMAVVGFEVDQVRKTPDGDVSVPINVAYNHHFESTMSGKGSYFEKVPVLPGQTPLDVGGHGAPNLKEAWVLHPREGTDEYSKLDTPANSRQSFGGANGGEYRKSFHGYPPGMAQLIDSPQEFQITPMQIDTWNRDHMNLTESKFVPGPVPRNSWAPVEGPDAIYSGLLECPLTTRVRKVLNANYALQDLGQCSNSIETSAECFEAVRKVMDTNISSTKVVNDPSLPSGCTVEGSPVGGVTALFNQATKAGDCGTGASGSLIGAATSLVNLSIHVDAASDLVEITISGPVEVWFGVGFNATAMADEPWAIIIDGAGNVTERKLMDQSPGTALASSVTVKSHTVINGVRTVSVTRPLAGKGSAYFNFPTGLSRLPFINAIGSGPTLAYHKNKAPSVIELLPINIPVCVCSIGTLPFGTGAAKGVITYDATNQTEDVGSGTVTFSNRCAPLPTASLLAQHNPTCDIRTYVGGQLSCHHMWSLLDADQPIPWSDKPLTYHLKYRFWVQEYTDLPTPSHKAIVRYGFGDLGAGGGGTGAEYDVPKCGDGVPGCSRGADGTWVHTITGLQAGRGKLVAAHFHCHAPTCLSMEIRNNKTGEVYCRSEPLYGSSPKIEDPKFREAGFIAVPPCLFGDAEYGLDAPPDLDGVMLFITKTANATYGHHGEMAHSQFYFIE